MQKAGYQRRSDKMLDELGHRLRDAGVDFSPDLTDPANAPDTRIYFFDSTRPVQGLQPTRELFKREEQLARFLWLNRNFLTQATKHLRIRDREKQLAPGAKIDLVAVDTRSGELVGIELKAEHPDHGIVAQSGRYMKALKAQAEAEGRRGARLVIISGQPDEELAEQVQAQAEKVGVKVEWMLYRVRFELNPA